MLVMKTTGPSILKINDLDDMIVIVRRHERDENISKWGIKQEEDAIKSADSLVKYIQNCLKYKRDIWDLIKEKEKPDGNQT